MALLMARRRLLVVLTLICIAVGALAFLAPYAFYRHVLGVDKLGPYDQHLVTDVGGFYLGFALLLGWAARSLERPLVRAASATFLLTQGLHFGYHLLHLERFTAIEAIAQTVELGVMVVLPALVLGLSANPGRPSDYRR